MGTPVHPSFEAHGIEIKTPSDPDWGFYSSTYNVCVPVTPKIVILPATVEQVSLAVIHASSLGLTIQARSGGHSYASHSSGGIDGSAVVDLRKLQDVELVGNGIVRVGGGVRLGNLARIIFEQHGRALTHGTCPAVGVGGHFTHGGFGMASRAWGLSMDQIVALDVVTADGKLVRASASENADLFYAMRGAADSFGIVVNFYLQTQPAPDSVVKFTINVKAAMKSVSNAVQTFQHIQSFSNDRSAIDRRTGFVLFFSHERFSIDGIYLGDLEAFISTVLPPLLAGFPQDDTTLVDISVTDWVASLQLLSGGVSLKVGPEYEEHHAFYAKGGPVAHPGVSAEALEKYFTHILREGPKAPVEYFLGAQLYGGYDSQITARSKDEHAAEDSFAHRDAMWMFQHYGHAKDGEEFPAEGYSFVQGVHDALGAVSCAYNNYPDPLLEPGKALKMYYKEKLPRLVALKGVLDPDNVFAHPQSVPKLL
ncbi:Glucooligosaccharide oxidase [Xylariaceae sp. FL0594]|nr:Glucooligosaccharide oxidase [Xylariaceae sp. FL0594]